MGAEVGVLEIQIHDNSEKAASGLDNLASALTRVQDALGSKLKIGTMATQIGKLVEKMQTAIPEESISRIERLAAAVEKLGAVGKVSAPSLKGLKIDSVKEAAKDAGGGDMFSESASTIETINEAQEETVKKIVEEKAAAREAQEAMQGVAESTERAAEEAGNVSEAMAPARDAIQEAKEEARQMKEEFQGASQAAERIKSSTGKMKRFNPATGQFEEFNEASQSVSAAEIYQKNVQRRFQKEVADFRRDLDFQGSNSTAGLNSASIDTMLGIGSSSIKSAEESLGVFIEKASEAQKVSWELMDTLNRPVTLDLASAINQTLGIGAPIKSAEESLNVFIERATDAQRVSWELMDTLNRPVDLNWANAIDKMQGIGAPFKSAEDSMNVFIESASEAQRISWELIDTLNTPVNLNWADAIEQLQGIGAPVKSAEESMSAFMQAMQGDSGTAANIRELNPELQELCDEAIRNGTAVSGLTGKLADLDGELKQKKKDTNEARSAFQQFREDISSMTAPITGFIGQLARVARYRMLRAIIKQISEGFKEGVENYYHYSEAINNGFSAAMDSAATSLQTFKNSIGATVAPLIQALIPVLQQAVTWFVSLINYANQFIALLSGKTSWSMAVDTTAKAFEETKKKAGGATKAIKDTDKAVKDLLADFDELNIIQSETGGNGGSGSGGGGGGSGKTATDYKKMFTEVSDFDNGIKSLVENLKDNFGSILNLAAKIGAAVLAWRVSSAFSGIIGQAAGLLGSAIILDVVFRLSKTFTSTFLDTGEEGWLLLSGLTPLVGGFIARRLLTQIGLRGLASYAIPISLALGATATISANIERADVSTLDAKTIESLVLAAIEMGGAAGVALNEAGLLTAAGSVGAGAAAALITFGVAIGLKESAMVLETGKLTKESILIDFGSAAFVGAGLSLSHGVLSLSASSAASAGAGGGLMTFGVLMGLQAALTLAENGEITEAKVWNALGIQAGSSLIIGAGAAVLGISALGSAGLAFAAFGLFLTLDAIITNNKPKKIMWGNSELTDEQIESWVNDKMFKVSVKATISKIETVLGNNKATREEIESGMADVETDLGVIELGLADETTYENLRKSIFGENGEGGVIGRLKQYASEQQVTIKTSMTLLPLLNENGEEDSQRTAEVMRAGLTGWTEVQRYMTELGGKLSDALKAGSKAGLEGYDDELIQTLTEKLTNVQRAVTGAQLSSAATGDLLTNLTGLSADDAQGIIDTYERYKEQLSDGYNKILQEELSSYQGLAAFYRARGEEGDDALAEYYEGLASELVKEWPERVARGVEEAGGEGKKIIAKKLSELFMLSPSDLTGRVYNDALQQSMAGALEISIRNSNMQNSSDVKDSMKQWLDSILKASLTEGDYNIVSGALSSGILKYTDLFSQETIDQLTSQWQGDNNPYKTVIQEAWQEMLADALGKKPKKIVAEEAEVEQTVVAETVVEQEEPEVSDEGGFDWSNYDFGAGNFEFELTDFHGAGTMEEWEELWDAMFANGTGTDAAANALRERLNEIVEMAFLGTGQGSKILEALKNGDLNYGDVIKESVIQSIEEALGLEYDSPEIQEKWNAILEEIFGGEYAPELEVDPELTGKTNGTQWGARASQTASRATGYYGDTGVWAGSQKLNDTWDKTTDAESVQAGVQGGTVQLQTDLQNGMANRKSDIQNGVQAGTGSLLTALNNILATAQAISRKEFTVNLVPSAGFGRFMGQSSDEYSRVTGDV